MTWYLRSDTTSRFGTTRNVLEQTKGGGWQELLNGYSDAGQGYIEVGTCSPTGVVTLRGSTSACNTPNTSLINLTLPADCSLEDNGGMVLRGRLSAAQSTIYTPWAFSPPQTNKKLAIGSHGCHITYNSDYDEGYCWLLWGCNGTLSYTDIADTILVDSGGVAPPVELNPLFFGAGF
jgi:hypothetical protein